MNLVIFISSFEKHVLYPAMKGLLRKRTLFALLTLLLPEIRARSWRDFVLLYEESTADQNCFIFLSQQELNIWDHPREKIALPTFSPSPAPTANPTDFPSSMPTSLQSQNPSTSPTLPESELVTAKPTNAPTTLDDYYRENEEPVNPNGWYFNYDNSPGNKYGPGQMSMEQQLNGFYQIQIVDNHWGSVERPPIDYWVEFTDRGFGPWKGVLQNHRPLRNICEDGLLQSPVDVRENGAICHEFHQIRTLPGDFQVTGNHVERRIEPNKLRLVYRRRPCANYREPACSEPDPPAADFPSGWGGMSDAIHIDFKVPSEHKIHGESFDAEMQIYYLHPSNRRLAAQAVLIRAQQNGYNYYLQEALNAFQKEYDENKAKCGRRLQHQRHSPFGNHSAFHRNLTGTFTNYFDWAKKHSTFQGESNNLQPGPPQFQGVWNPNHQMLTPTIYFYRYDGSLTEPPCGEFVSWFVADKPMVIGFEQLEQMKRIISTNVDENCRRTSVHHKQSVARPIRPSNGRPIWRCTAEDFGPDMPII
jgi:carbonic anhydrase